MSLSISEFSNQVKIINVPSGHSARLSCNGLRWNVAGLYSDLRLKDVVIICIGEEQVNVQHIDVLSPCIIEQMDGDIGWVDGRKKICLLFKDSENGLVQSVIKYVSDTYDAHIVQKQVPETAYGISISFNGEDIQKEMNYYEARPENLISHPQEEQIITFDKIKQVIPGITRLCIFSGMSWYNMKDDKLENGDSSSLVKINLDMFEKDDTYNTICHKLHMSGEMRLEYAHYIESYFGGYDEYRILLNNLKSLYTGSGCEHLCKVIKSDNILHDLDIMINGSYSPEILQLLKDYRNDFERRHAYKEVNKIRNRYMVEGGKLHNQAMQCLKAGKYNKAKDKFLHTIKIYTVCSYIENSDLATAYYNYSICCTKLGEHHDAHRYMFYCLDLRNNYCNDSAIIEQTRTAIQECRNRLI